MTRASLKQSWEWWLYIAVLLAGGYGRTFERLGIQSGGFWSQLGPSIGVTVVAIGIAFWLVRKPLLNAWIWRGVHALLSALSLAALAFAAYLAAIELYVPAAVIGVLAAALVPAMLAMFRYAYRSPEIWGHPQA